MCRCGYVSLVCTRLPELPCVRLRYGPVCCIRMCVCVCVCAYVCVSIGLTAHTDRGAPVSGSSEIMCVCVCVSRTQGLIQEYVVSGLTAELPGLAVVESGWGLVRCALPIGPHTPPMSAIFKVRCLHIHTHTRARARTRTYTCGSDTRAHTHTHMLASKSPEWNLCMSGRDTYIAQAWDGQVPSSRVF